MMKSYSRFAAFVLLQGVSFFTLSGCIGSITVGDPKWEPPVLSKTGCKNLDGVYLGDSLYFAFLSYGRKNPNTDEWDVSRPISNVISLKEIPGSEYKVWERSGRKVTYLTRDNDKAKEFDIKKRTLVQIKEQGGVYYADSEGSHYAKQILNMENQDAGCRDGMLVLRFLYFGGGAEFTPRNATAIETQFEKLPNGDIQTRSCMRRWTGTMNSEPSNSCRTELHRSAK